MDKLLDLLRESTIVQAAVTLILVIALVYLWCTGQTPPDTLVQLTYVVVGYWFGSKVQQAIGGSKSLRH